MSTVYISGESRTNADNAITKVYGSFFVAFEIDLETDVIIQAECSGTLELTRDFLKRIFINKNIIKDEEEILTAIQTRYFGSSNKAACAAFRDANIRYKMVKEKL